MRNVQDAEVAIDALKRQVQRIAFDANLWDLGIADYPYAEACSKKKKALIAQIRALGGEYVTTLGSRQKIETGASGGQTGRQMEMFFDQNPSDTSQNLDDSGNKGTIRTHTQVQTRKKGRKNATASQKRK